MMKNKNTRSLISVLSNILIASVTRFNEIIYLAELEAKLAVKTLINICILLYLSTLLLLAAWLSVLVVLFFYLTSLQFSPLFAACILFALNVILIITVFVSILTIKKNLFFRATRRQLRLTVKGKTNNE